MLVGTAIPFVIMAARNESILFPSVNSTGQENIGQPVNPIHSINSKVVSNVIEQFINLLLTCWHIILIICKDVKTALSCISGQGHKGRHENAAFGAHGQAFEQLATQRLWIERNEEHDIL
jgi:hypothetical protein